MKLKNNRPVQVRLFIMKKFLMILAMLWGVAYGQSTGYFRYDTIRMQRGGGNCELYIENGTRGVTGGVLTNMGGGRTAFVTPAAGIGTASNGLTKVVNDVQLGGTLTQNTTIALGGFGFSFSGNGPITIPSTTSASTGVIYKGSDIFLHNFTLAGTSGRNTFLGINAGNLTMTGSSGVQQGSDNTGVGPGVLSTNTTGFRNTVVGALSLQNNTTGNSNTAIGYGSLFYNSTGQHNLAVGIRAMQNNTTGEKNYAFGTDALFDNTSGIFNTGISVDALYRNTTGSYNTAVGDSTLWIATIGIKNTAVGSRAGYYLGDSDPNYGSVKDSMVTFLGADASRDNSIANTTALKNLTVIGYNAKGTASNQVVIGNSSVTQHVFYGALMPNNLPGTSGQVLTSAGAGISPTWATPSASGANTALSNLASVAVNTSLISDTDNTDDLGSTSIKWRKAYLGDLRLRFDATNYYDASVDNTNLLTIAPQNNTTPGVLYFTGQQMEMGLVPFVAGNTTNGYPGAGYNFSPSTSGGVQNYRRSGDPAYRISFGASSRMDFQTAVSGTAPNPITWDNRMTILQSNGNVGINNTSPTSKLHVSGSLSLPIRLVTADLDVITADDHTLAVENDGNNWTETLPDAATCFGRIYLVTRANSSSTGKITIASAGGDVQSQNDGIFSSTYDIQDTGEGLWGGKFSMAKLQSDGTNWRAIK